MAKATPKRDALYAAVAKAHAGGALNLPLSPEFVVNKRAQRLLLVTLVFFATLAVTVSGSEAPQWVKMEADIKIPLSLRVVNEGLANDGQSWFFSQQHFLVATTIDPIEQTMINVHATPQELRDLGYAHIGDIDVDKEAGIIYGGIEIKGGDHPGVLAKWRTSDLSLISYDVTTMNGMPWVAVDPSSRLLYSAVWNDRANLTLFDMDTFEPRGVLTVPSGLPGEIQGGAFWQGDLYLAANSNCSVYRLDMKTLDLTLVLSDRGDKPWQYEMEGLDFLDLRQGSQGQGLGQGGLDLGVMHVYGNFMGAEKALHNFNPPPDASPSASALPASFAAV